MGSSISKIYDDYDDYEVFCETIGVKSINIDGNSEFSSFYKHEDYLLKQLGYKNIQDYYSMLRKAGERDKKIDSIFDDEVDM